MSQMKVCQLLRYRLTPSGKLDEEVEPKVLRKRVVINERQIEDVNSRTKQNGKFYKVLEDETKEYIEETEEYRKEMQEYKKKEKAASKAYLDDKPKRTRKSKSETK